MENIVYDVHNEDNNQPVNNLHQNVV